MTGPYLEDGTNDEEHIHDQLPNVEEYKVLQAGVSRNFAQTGRYLKYLPLIGLRLLLIGIAGSVALFAVNTKRSSPAQTLNLSSSTTTRRVDQIIALAGEGCQGVACAPETNTLRTQVGVSCFGGDSVKDVFLPSNNLQGELPSEIGLLTALEEFNCSGADATASLLLIDWTGPRTSL